MRRLQPVAQPDRAGAGASRASGSASICCAGDARSRGRSYQALRARWQGSPARFFVFFQLQALLVALFSLPFVGAASNPAASVGPWTLAAIAVWIVSITGELLADLQLAAHRADPANSGKTCRRGLWAWSRHPNYFFEWLH